MRRRVALMSPRVSARYIASRSSRSLRSSATRSWCAASSPWTVCNTERRLSTVLPQMTRGTAMLRAMLVAVKMWPRLMERSNRHPRSRTKSLSRSRVIAVSPENAAWRPFGTAPAWARPLLARQVALQRERGLHRGLVRLIGDPLVQAPEPDGEEADDGAERGP